MLPRIAVTSTALVAALAIAGCAKDGAAAGDHNGGNGAAAAVAMGNEGGNGAAAAVAMGNEGGNGAAGAAVATPAPSPAGDGKTYGAGVTQSESVPIAKLLADPKAYEGKAVRVEGTVTDVCPKRGCWFEMAGQAPGEKMRFKVRDGEMVFPMDAKGKFAVAEGVVAVQPLTLEQTRQYLTYQAEEYGSEVDPASVTEPMTIVRLDGTGAQIRDRK